MERKELAQKVLRELDCPTIPCCVSCYSAEYSEVFPLSMGEESVRYLIKDKISDPSILEGLEFYKCTLQDLCDEVVLSSIDDDGEFEYESESPAAENYINSLALLINRILDGTITEDTIDDYLKYFSDGDFDSELEDPLNNK